MFKTGDEVFLEDLQLKAEVVSDDDYITKVKLEIEMDAIAIKRRNEL